MPREADAEIVEVADNEKVVIKQAGRFKCTDDGIETRVQYQIRPQDGAQGTQVKVWGTAGGPTPLASTTGEVGVRLTLDVLIPASCDDGDDD